MNAAIVVLYVFVCLLAAIGIALCFVIIRQDYEIKLLRSDLERLQLDFVMHEFITRNFPGSAPVEDK